MRPASNPVPYVPSYRQGRGAFIILGLDETCEMTETGSSSAKLRDEARFLHQKACLGEDAVGHFGRLLSSSKNRKLDHCLWDYGY